MTRIARPGEETTPFYKVRSPIGDIATIVVVFCVLCTWLYFRNYAQSSWYDDELMFSQASDYRNALELKEIISRAIADKWEFHAPIILFLNAISWRLFGNDSAACKLLASMFILIDALLLYGILCRITRRRAYSLIGALLLLVCPALVESYTWSTAVQHVVTVGLGLALVLLTMAGSTAFDQGKRPQIAANLLCLDAVGFVAGYAREPILVFAVVAVGCLWTVSGYASRKAAIFSFPILFILPEQIQTLTNNGSGHQVAKMLAAIGRNAITWPARVGSLPLDSPLIYCALLALQVILVTLLLSNQWQTKAKTENRVGTSPIANVTGIALFILICALATFASARMGLIFISAVLPFGFLIDGFNVNLSGRWIGLAAYSLPCAAAIMVATAWWTWRRLPPLILVAVFTAEASAMLYLGALGGDIVSSGPALTTMYSRYSIYLLPIVSVLAVGGLDAIDGDHRFIAAPLFLMIAVDATVLCREFDERCAAVKASFFPAKFDLPSCNGAVGEWGGNLGSYNYLLNLIDHMPPLTYHLISGDHTVQRWLKQRDSSNFTDNEKMKNCLLALQNAPSPRPSWVPNDWIWIYDVEEFRRHVPEIRVEARSALGVNVWRNVDVWRASPGRDAYITFDRELGLVAVNENRTSSAIIIDGNRVFATRWKLYGSLNPLNTVLDWDNGSRWERAGEAR